MVPNPPIQANMPPDINIENKRIESCLCLIAGIIPNAIPKTDPENPPIIAPSFIVANLDIKFVHRILFFRT